MINAGDIVDGKYRVTRVLGQGGMGVVVEAHHENLDTLVAIKFMRPNFVLASGGAERFLREAKVLVKLKSQHAVKVHDLGVHKHMPFIVMEHLEGMDMQTMLDKHGPMNAGDAARHLRQACEAIAEAHSLGIYHRDLKPANLFLANGPSGRIIVKVLDFGIAKILRTSADKASQYASLTGANILMGTVPYMSPEQLMSAKDIDGRADIWSMGILLHELVTGELPFSGEDMYQLQQAIQYRPPEMKSVPSILEPIIRQCLQKRPEARYQSVVDLAIALRPVVTESFSPFGTVNARLAARPSQEGATHSATASPIPGSRPIATLAAAEGLGAPTDPASPTVLAIKARALDTMDQMAPTEAAPTFDAKTTIRMPAPRKSAHTGTLIMAPESNNPESSEGPTVWKLPAELYVAAPQAPITGKPSAERPPVGAASTLRSQPVPRELLNVKQATPPQVVIMPAVRPEAASVGRDMPVVHQPVKWAKRRVPSRRALILVGACAVVAVLAFIVSYSFGETVHAASPPSSQQ
ncbi:MAG: protein kinase [Polyangiaceae bacterium]|nr:protein kinase [Polyangiaceae bacterium]